MCGISCVIGSCSCEHAVATVAQYGAALDKAAAHRGPDASAFSCAALGGASNVHIRLAASVLHMRGNVATVQPARCAGNSSETFLWNGEVFGGVHVDDDRSDTTVILSLLASTGPGLANLVATLSPIRGPFSFILHRASEAAIYVGRDVLGRRSMLLGLAQDDDSVGITAVLASVGPFEMALSDKLWWRELPPGGIYRISIQEVPVECTTAETMCRVADRFPVTATAGVMERWSIPACRRCGRGSQSMSSGLRRHVLQVEYQPWPLAVHLRVGAAYGSAGRIFDAERNSDCGVRTGGESEVFDGPSCGRECRGDTCCSCIRALVCYPAPELVSALPPPTDRDMALAGLELLRRLSEAVRVRVCAATARGDPTCETINSEVGALAIVHPTTAPVTVSQALAAIDQRRMLLQASSPTVGDTVAAGWCGTTAGHCYLPANAVSYVEKCLAISRDLLPQMSSDTAPTKIGVESRDGAAAASERSPHSASEVVAARVAVLYSGGVDSQLLARLAHEHVPPREPIDLINVCFAGGASPDRAAAISGVAELRAIAPDRQWQLILVDEDYVGGAVENAHVLRQLLYPRGGLMDFNIAVAMYHAARGIGFVDVDVHIGSTEGNTTDPNCFSTLDAIRQTLLPAQRALHDPSASPRAAAVPLCASENICVVPTSHPTLSLPRVATQRASPRSVQDSPILRYARGTAASLVRQDGDHKLSAFQRRRHDKIAPTTHVASTALARSDDVSSVHDLSPHAAVARCASDVEVAAALRGSFVAFHTDGTVDGARNNGEVCVDSCACTMLSSDCELYELPDELRAAADRNVAATNDLRDVKAVHAYCGRGANEEAQVLNTLFIAQLSLASGPTPWATTTTAEPSSVHNAAPPVPDASVAGSLTEGAVRSSGHDRPRLCRGKDAYGVPCPRDLARKCSRKMCGDCCRAMESQRPDLHYGTTEKRGMPTCRVHGSVPISDSGITLGISGDSLESNVASEGLRRCSDPNTTLTATSATSPKAMLTTRVLVRSSARVLLSGIGADEQAGGYGRHRTAFATGRSGCSTGDDDEEGRDDAPGGVGNGTTRGWRALRRELVRDCGRLWLRNLGRDDRVCSDSGRELRQPFLDEGVALLLRRLLPLSFIVDPRLPHGVGDKRIVRVAAYLAGLHESAALVKRAIHFGTRIAQAASVAAFGSVRAGRGAGDNRAALGHVTNSGGK